MAKEKKHWIADAIKHPGKLREKLHVKPGKDIPQKKLAAAERSKNGTLRKEAMLAEELKHFHHGK